LDLLRIQPTSLEPKEPLMAVTSHEAGKTTKTTTTTTVKKAKKKSGKK
jgi:hypothetical protein